MLCHLEAGKGVLEGAHASLDPLRGCLCLRSQGHWGHQWSEMKSWNAGIGCSPFNKCWGVGWGHFGLIHETGESGQEGVGCSDPYTLTAVEREEKLRLGGSY